MSAGSAAKLYTPDLLSLATELAACPLAEGFPYTAETRSRTCGSTLAIGLQLGDEARIERLGMRVYACAVGQASAALFARGAKGLRMEAIKASVQELEAWLAGAGPLPAWPGFCALEPARDHSARHGAILLPWKAALEALSIAEPSG